jgi:hypothetical protein
MSLFHRQECGGAAGGFFGCALLPLKGVLRNVQLFVPYALIEFVAGAGAGRTTAKTSKIEKKPPFRTIRNRNL